MSDPNTRDCPEGVAVIGMAGRFPGAGSVDEFWRNLCDGKETIQFFTDEELLAAGVSPSLLNNPAYVKAAGLLEGVELFDASFFGFSPREAETMDPQHRFFLETAWEALENAGYNSETYPGAISVFGGVGANTYLFNLYSNHEFITSVDTNQLSIGNEREYLTTRVSYKLNLRGPSLDVQTACSTSLVAVHLACQSLLDYQSDMALAGGALVCAQKAGYLYVDGGFMSPDGHNRSFDAKARGSVGGNGTCLVVLKRVEDALADGDFIHAVIRGSAVNNDGSLKVGYTAPSVEGQAEVIIKAQALADVEAETISYMEAHGTATPLGDPIEIAAYTKAFRAGTEAKGFCAVGSAKSNVGHLGEAAGVTGLIKTVLALRHKLIPPSLHFEQPNPQIDFENSPFYVNDRLSEWKAGPTPRRAGVSAFGIGGTNAHVIVEEVTEGESGDSRPLQLLLLSAKTDSALEAATDNLAAHLRRQPAPKLADAAYTLKVGRRAFRHRRMLVCRDAEDAAAALTARDPRRVFTSPEADARRPLAFMFAGLGDQYVGMARGLYLHEPPFREHVDRCAELLRPMTGLDVREVIYPGGARATDGDASESSSALGARPDLRAMLRRGGGRADDEADARLNRTSLVHPALFVIEYALAGLLAGWGLRPEIMIGYSLGEYVAACVAGVFSLPDALRLVVSRARLIEGLPPGAMLAVPLAEAEAREWLGAHLSLAAVNGPEMCVAAGPPEAVADLERRLGERGLASRRLQASHAFHSHMMEPVVGPLTELVASMKLSPPQIPYLSNVTGGPVTAEQATDPHYWASHLTHTVRFADGARELWQKPGRVLVEIGPGQTLGSLALQNLPAAGAAGGVVLPTLRHAYDQQPDAGVLLNTVGRLWVAGAEADWAKFYAGETRRRVPLPTYPFERRRYWVDAKERASLAPETKIEAGMKADIADWFYLPSWKRSLPPGDAPAADFGGEGQCWLVLVDGHGLGAALARRLRQHKQEVVTVSPGERFAKDGDESYVIDPRRPEDYDALLGEIQNAGRKLRGVAHLWGVTGGGAPYGAGSFDEAQAKGFYSLLFFTQALQRAMSSDPLKIAVVADHVHQVAGGEMLSPEKATLLGPCLVVPQENLHVACQCIDVVLPEPGGGRERRLVEQLLAELASDSTDVLVAYRGNQRWVRSYEQARLERREGDAPGPLRENGVYVITGGMGGVGMLVAEHLARSVAAKVVLLGRTAFPPPDEWDAWLSAHDETDAVSRGIRKLRAVEEAGAEVMTVRADVTSEEQMRAAFALVAARFGAVHGVFHAAGVASGKLIQDMTRADCEAQFAAKARGLYVLAKILREAAPDFCLLFSSNASVLGGLGFFAYSAANCFMDAFAADANRDAGPRWVSANWDGWVLPEQKNLPRTFHMSVARYIMEPEESVEALHRVVSAAGAEQIVVSRGDLFTRLDTWIKRESLLKPAAAADTGGAALHPRPSLQNAYVAPRDEVEEGVARLLGKLLGIERVGVHDNFFDLGGHSLLALQFFAQIRQEHHVELPLTKIFETPTVAGLAATVAELKDEVARALEELEGLSDDEVQLLLDAEAGP